MPSDLLQNLLRRLPIPAAPPAGPEVCVLPAAAFFLRVVERPVELPAKEWESFAELTLEGLSPFPLDQLAWGWYTRPDSRRLIVFAAHRPRLDSHGPDGWAEAPQALPGLLAVLGAAAANPSDTIAVLVEGHLVAARGDGTDPIPAEIATEPLAGPADDPGAVAAAITALSRRHPQFNLPPATAVPVVTRAALSSRGGCRFEGPAGHFVPTELTETQSWAADVRDPDFKLQARRLRRTQRISDYAVVGALAAALLLLVLQLTTFGFRIASNSRATRIKAQAEVVSRLQAMQSLGVKVDQFARQELQPLLMLEVLNRYRPRSLHFTRTETQDRNRLRIEGEAVNAVAVNTFNDLLAAAPEIAEARVDRLVSQDGRARYTLLVTFESEALFAAAEVEPLAASTNP